MLNEKCHFDRKDWNLWDRYSSRTNNLSETYNHKINGQVISSKSNVFKVLDVVQKQEALTSVTFERVNLGKVKKSTNAQQVKDASIALLKQKYKNNELEVMDYLIKISSFVKKLICVLFKKIILWFKFSFLLWYELGIFSPKKL